MPLAQIDHLVVAARSLDEAVRWCEATLGVTPGPGGEHPLMGTHNRLLRLATDHFPTSYLELIAINPIAPQPTPARAGRWFDLDSPALQSALAHEGPRLVHFVASVPAIDTALKTLTALGLDRGPALAASRQTPRGLLQWQISVRDDGQRLLDGCLPTLIEWGDTHPAGAMPESGVTLQALTLIHPRAADLRAACDALGLQGVVIKEGPANLLATLRTPRGTVVLESKGL